MKISLYMSIKTFKTAKKSYQFVSYKNIDWDKRFTRRHDVDYSLNRI